MEEIIKTLLLEGIDEETIHRVLDVIEEEYEVVDEGENLEDVVKRAKRAKKISSRKAEELRAKAIEVPSEIDTYKGRNGKRIIGSKWSASHKKGYFEELNHRVNASTDPKRIERKASVGKVVAPESTYPEVHGEEVLKQARIQRKLQKSKDKNNK